MYPEFDLLYQNPQKILPSKEIDMSMQSLLLEEVVSGVTVDIVLQRKVYELLKYPEQDLANIIHRRELIKDFRKNSTLLHEFELIKEINDTIKDSLKIVKTNTSSIQTTSGGKSSKSDRESSVFTVQTLADCILKTLKMYEEYDKTFARNHVESAFFQKMQQFVHSQVENPAFSELKRISEGLADSLNLSSSFVVLAKLDQYMRILDCEIFRLTTDPYYYKPGSEMKDKGMPVEYIEFDAESDQQLQFLAERSMIKLTEFMESIVYQLKAPFDRVEQGFFYYHFADLLYRAYENMALPCCLAEYSPDANRFASTEIYDLWFSLKQYKKNKSEKPGQTLVPNDAIMEPDCPAYIITGQNNAGKTVFLRAVGIIQVLAQAGLPIPCRTAVVTPVPHLFAYFTALDIGQGRFEEEVETVSGFLDLLQPDDMLLFNEVYQSTSYDEASEALSEFIAVAAMGGARVVAVTHLPDMQKNLSALQQRYGFDGKIRYMKAEEKDGKATHKFIQEIE